MIDSTFSVYRTNVKEWKMVPLAYACTEVKKRNLLLLEDNLLSLSYGKIIRKDIDSNEGLLPESFDGYNIVEPGDIVLRLTDLQNDKRSLRTGLVQERGIITSAYTTIRPTGVDARWLAYTLHSYDIQKVFYALGSGLRQSMKFDDLKSLAIAVPPLDEQCRIADYLDGVMKDLDQIISIREQQLANVAEIWKSDLVKAMADPESEFVPLKYFAWWQEGPGIMSEDFMSDGVPIIRISHLRANPPSLEDCQYVELPKGFGKWKNYHTQLGDLIISASAATDAIAIKVSKEMIGAIPYTGLIRIRPKSEALSLDYLRYFLLSSTFFDQVERLKQGIGIQHWGPSHLSQVALPLPTLKRQTEIVTFLTQRENCLVLTSKAIETSLGIFQELRKSLITAAVTGTFDVTTGRSVA